MIEAFESVGVESFEITVIDEPGEKRSFESEVKAEHLEQRLPAQLKHCESKRHNFIIRPRAGADLKLVQLDDLGEAAVEKVAPYSFLVIETSPGNHQAWVAVDGVDKQIERRLKAGVGADLSASGAARIAGSRNFKPKHAPSYPYIRLKQVQAGRVVTVAELDQVGLIAPDEEIEPPPPSPVIKTKSPKTWPSYQRCLKDAPPARNHNGKNRSAADFQFCLISIDRGWSVEAVANRLMIESDKARQKGFKYALHTARRASELVAKPPQ